MGDVMLWGMLVTLAATWFAAGFAAAWVLYRRKPEPEDAPASRPDEDRISRTAPLPPLDVGAVFSNGFEQVTVLDVTPWRVIVATKSGGVRGWTVDEFRRNYPHRLTQGEFQ